MLGSFHGGHRGISLSSAPTGGLRVTEAHYTARVREVLLVELATGAGAATPGAPV